MKIAILALQGAFAEHEQMLSKLGCDTFLIRRMEHLTQPMDGLIIPGGESTTMLRQLTDTGMLPLLREKIENGLPVMGTCAGMILLAKTVEGEERERLATMDITVRRNAYGRQLGSFHTEATLRGIDHDIPMTFIRAPFITSVGEDAEVLAEVDGNIVAARQGKQIALSFHPELDDDLSIHRMFLSTIEG